MRKENRQFTHGGQYASHPMRDKLGQIRHDGLDESQRQLPTKPATKDPAMSRGVFVFGTKDSRIRNRRQSPAPC